jgi:hypothetical protein
MALNLVYAVLGLPVRNVCVLAFFCALIGNVIYFDQLLRREYSIARTDWEIDGRPSGFFWQQSGDVSRSWLIRSRSAIRWWFTTPSWVKADVVAKATHKRYRAWSWITFGAWLLFMWVVLTGRG